MTNRYTNTAKALHWAMAILLFGLLALGFYMHDLPLSPQKLQFYSWHKWAGVTVFLLVIVRLAWRVTHQPPALPAGLRQIHADRALPDSLPEDLQKAVHAGHFLLYALMIAIPLSGWLMSSAKGFQTVWFGILPIPDLIGKNKEAGDILQNVHVSLNFFFIVVIAGHVGAALKHHFIDRDDILTRMLPGHSREN